MSTSTATRIRKADLPEGYEVFREEYDVACDHPACDTMHRHLYNSEYVDGPRSVDLYNMDGQWIGSRRESRFHMARRTEWTIALNGERVGDVHDTQQGAYDEIVNRRPTI